MKIKDVRARKWTNVKVDMDTTGRALSPGDLYVAKRNTAIGWILLECKKVDLENGWVEPTDSEYLFDLHECHKVVRTALK